MSEEGINKFVSRVESVVETSRKCEEITYCEILGALRMIEFDILQEVSVDESGDDDCIEDRQCSDCKWEFDLGGRTCPFFKICEEYPFRMFERKE